MGSGFLSPLPIHENVTHAGGSAFTIALLEFDHV
jgi:hypothetical protein